MNWDRIEGNRKQIEGSAKQQRWRKLTDDQPDVMSAQSRKHTAFAKNETDKQIAAWQGRPKAIVNVD